MNLHGYKKKHKNIKSLLKREKKKGKKGHPEKVKRLELAKKRCSRKIKKLRLENVNT